jgi:hypothetical protein
MTISTQTFVSVNTGTVANDGLGDSLRQAFIKVNSNFSNISTSGFNAGNILAAGTVQAGYFSGDGSLLTNLPLAVTSYSNINVKAYTESMGFRNYSNANVASYLTTYSGVVTASNVSLGFGNVITGNVLAGNVIAGNIHTPGNVYAQMLIGSVVAYTNIMVKTPNYITVSNTWVYTLSSTISDNILLVTNPGGITATINMPVTPQDGQVCRISANANVTLAAGSGTVQPPFAGGNVLTTTFQYIYRNSASTWYKN